MKMHVSKAYKDSLHIGWKKTVGGKSHFLAWGTTPSAEAVAKNIAIALEAKWQLLKLGGTHEWTQADIDEAFRLGRGEKEERPRAPDEPTAISPQFAHPDIAFAVPQSALTIPAVAGSRRWLFASIDELVAIIRRELRPDRSNADDVFNRVDRIRRAQEATTDVPLDHVRRKELDEWLLNIKQLKSKKDGRALGSLTIRNLAGAVRTAMTKFAEWEWWTPPLLWEKAFTDYSVTKLQTPSERKERRKRPATHTITERRVLWHLATDFQRAVMLLADWAGHTQKEIATLAFDEINDRADKMLIGRDRHKTGVHGIWWLPPEAAEVLRRVVARTPRDRSRNPLGLAILTPFDKPLVYHADTDKRSRIDCVQQAVWKPLIRAASQYGVRSIPFKNARKGTAQLIRDGWGKEVSAAFLAHSDGDVQDQHYTRTALVKVEQAMRSLYPRLQPVFKPISRDDWDEVRRMIRIEQEEQSQQERDRLCGGAVSPAVFEDGQAVDEPLRDS